MNISNKLKELRKLNYFKQKDISAMIGISPSGYANWEQGISEPNLEYLIKLSKIYRVSIDYLLGIENEDFTKLSTSSENPLATNELRILQGYRTLDKSMKKLVEYYIENLIEIERERKTSK